MKWRLMGGHFNFRVPAAAVFMAALVLCAVIRRGQSLYGSEVYPSSRALSTDLVIVLDVSASAYHMWTGENGETGERGFSYAINEFILGLPENVKSLSLVMFNRNIIVPEGLNRIDTDSPESREAAASTVRRAVGGQFDATKNDPLGTNIGGAITGAAAEMGVGSADLERPVVMLMISDSWNSESTVDIQPGYMSEILSYPTNDLFFFAAEVADEFYMQKYVDKSKEAYIPLGEAAERFGGAVRRVETLEGLRAGLDEIRSAIAMIPDPSAREPEPERPPVQTPVPEEVVYEPGILMTVEFPLSPEEGMLAGANLSVSARMLGQNGLPVIDPEEYEKYEAEFHIQHEDDRSFYNYPMEPMRDGNSFRIELPRSGVYEFFVRFTAVDGEETLESAHSEVSVHNRSGVDGIRITDTRELIIEPGGDAGDSFGVRAVFNEPYAAEGLDTEKISGLYYDTYTATVAVEPGNLLFPMETDGMSYYADIPADGDGFRDYRVEAADQDGNVVYTALGTVMIIRDSYYAVVVFFGAAAVSMCVLARRIWKTRAGFTVSVSDNTDRIPNILVFCAEGGFRGGKVSLRDIFKAEHRDIVNRDSLRVRLSEHCAGLKKRERMIPGKSFTYDDVTLQRHTYSITVYCTFLEGSVNV